MFSTAPFRARSSAIPSSRAGSTPTTARPEAQSLSGTALAAPRAASISLPPMLTTPDVGRLLREHAGDAMALNDRFLNPQLGRIVRMLGFDRVWTGGEGAHLIDDEGHRYLDLLCGYGVFAVGRNHPDVIAAVQETLAARTPNMPQLGVTVLAGALGEKLVQRGPDSVAAMVPANSGTEAVEAAIKISR